MADAIIEIPKELFVATESSLFEGQLPPRSLQAGPDTYVFKDPLTWKVTVSNTGDALLVDGVVKAAGTTQCARCLEDMQVEITGHIEGYYLLPEAEDPPDREKDEFDYLPESHCIDLEPHILAAILVDVPLVPLCRKDCKGICPDCGVNLNYETCHCAARRTRRQEDEKAAVNPFAVLKDYRFEE